MDEDMVRVIVDKAIKASMDEVRNEYRWIITYIAGGMGAGIIALAFYIKYLGSAVGRSQESRVEFAEKALPVLTLSNKIIEDCLEALRRLRPGPSRRED